MALTPEQQTHLKDKLRARRSALLEEIRQELLASDQEPYIELAGRVRDVGEEATADLLVDLTLAEIDRQLRELRDVEAALLHINDGSYGICIECGRDIGFERLDAYPTATRCIEDQARHEQRFAHGPTPSL